MNKVVAHSHKVLIHDYRYYGFILVFKILCMHVFAVNNESYSKCGVCVITPCRDWSDGAGPLRAPMAAHHAEI